MTEKTKEISYSPVLEREAIEVIRKSIEKPIFSFDEDRKMQIFKTEYYYDGHQSVSDIIEKAKNMHIYAIAKTILFSEECDGLVDSHGNEIYCMSGFKERTKRLPTESDNIVVYHGVYFMTNTFDKGVIKTLSLVNFEIE